MRWRAGDDARVTTLIVAHTAHLDRASRAAARALLYGVFDDMTDEDWEHCLGGVHALVWDGTDLIGHASLIQRRLLHGGSALRAGWRRWQGPTSAMTPGGIVRTPEDDGGVYVLPAGARLDIGAELTCDWRDGDTW